MEICDSENISYGVGSSANDFLCHLLESGVRFSLRDKIRLDKGLDDGSAHAQANLLLGMFPVTVNNLLYVTLKFPG